MKKSFYISLSLSILSIIFTVFINIQIAKEYLRVDGKTKALFGIKELLQFSYQYYVAILGILALLLALFSKENQKSIILSASLAIISVALVFLRIWRICI